MFATQQALSQLESSEGLGKVLLSTFLLKILFSGTSRLETMVCSLHSSQGPCCGMAADLGKVGLVVSFAYSGTGERLETGPWFAHSIPSRGLLMVDGWSLGQVLAWWFLSQDYGPGFCSRHFIFWSIDAGSGVACFFGFSRFLTLSKSKPRLPRRGLSEPLLRGSLSSVLTEFPLLQPWFSRFLSMLSLGQDFLTVSSQTPFQGLSGFSA